jgi:hypothetical protein
MAKKKEKKIDDKRSPKAIAKEVERGIVEREAQLWRRAIARIVIGQSVAINEARAKGDMKPVDPGLLELMARDIISLIKLWELEGVTLEELEKEEKDALESPLIDTK